MKLFIKTVYELGINCGCITYTVAHFKTGVYQFLSAKAAKTWRRQHNCIFVSYRKMPILRGLRAVAKKCEKPSEIFNSRTGHHKSFSQMPVLRRLRVFFLCEKWVCSLLLYSYVEPELCILRLFLFAEVESVSNSIRYEAVMVRMVKNQK